MHEAYGRYPQSGRTERTNEDTKGARQGEVQAIVHDTSTEKRQNYKQPLRMDPNEVREKGYLEEDSYKILSQFYKELKDLLYHTADCVVACRRRDEEKKLQKHNLIVVPQLYQTEVLFRSHDQMGHQRIDKVQQRTLHRFDRPGMRKACDR